MPLSKARDRERKKQARLDTKLQRLNIQPKYDDNGSPEQHDSYSPSIIGWDADGNLVYEEG